MPAEVVVARSTPEPSRSERTRTALREAALARFVRDGFAATSVEDIASDAGVATRTFYRYFASKDEVLFVDYEARLDWFRRALSVRPRNERLTDSVLAAVDSFPDDPAVVTEVARMRTGEIDAARIQPHIRRVEAELAREIESHLLERGDFADDDDAHARLRVTVVSRAVAAAVFTALDTWMSSASTDLDELTELTRVALEVVEPLTG
jgi:AcrR family transcriptional regulator